MEKQEGRSLRHIPAPCTGQIQAGCPAAVSDGNYVYVSQLAAQPDGTLQADIRQQTRCILEQLLDILRQAGTDAQGLLQVSLTVADSRSMPAVLEVYRERIPVPGPALVWRLGRLPGALVAVDAVAKVRAKAAADAGRQCEGAFHEKAGTGSTGSGSD